MAATSVISVLLGRNELAPVCIGLDGWVVVAVLLLFTIDRDTSVCGLWHWRPGGGGGWPMADSRESGGITHHHRIQRLSRPDDRRPLAR